MCWTLPQVGSVAGSSAINLEGSLFGIDALRDMKLGGCGISDGERGTQYSSQAVRYKNLICHC